MILEGGQCSFGLLDLLSSGRRDEGVLRESV